MILHLETLHLVLLNYLKNAYIDNCKCSGYSIRFYLEGTFSFPTGEFGKKVIIFRVDMSSSVHFENKIKDISILDEGLIQGLDDTTLAAVKKYSLNFTKHNEKFSLGLYYN